MRIPGYRCHKATGQAVVTLSGKDFYLGKFDSPESHEKYRQLTAEYIASSGSPAFGEKANRVTMAQVVLAYQKHAKAYYGDGSEFKNLCLATKPVSELYADSFSCNFGPAEYKACRTWQAKEGRTRQYVNKLAKMLLRIIRWAVSEGMMPAATSQACQCVSSFKRGRTNLPESKPVKAVTDSKVDSTIEYLSPIVADMVRFQKLTGARPGEICILKPSMVDRSSDVWVAELTEHKTAHRGKTRVIAVGPKAQAILAKYLLRDPAAFCFSPVESEEWRLRIRSENRTTPIRYGNSRGTNKLNRPSRSAGERYTTVSYGKAIKYACAKAFPEPEGLIGKAKKDWRKSNWWAPNQLRHSAATSIRKEFGLEAAQVILGHSEMGTTQVYAEQDTAKAIAVAKAVG